MKRVLFLIPTLGGGGAERVLVNLVNNLDPEKYDITVQTLFSTDTNAQDLGRHIRFKQGKRKPFRGNVRFFKIFSPQFLYRRIVREKYDIAVSYLEGPTARIISGCPFPESKLVNWVHVEQNTTGTAAYSYRSVDEMLACHARFRQSVCVAETVKKDFTGLVKIEHPCSVLYNTNETEKIRQKGREEIEAGTFSDGLNVISLGRLIAEKGYDRLIDVHRRLLDEGLKHQIYILGEGQMGERLKVRARELGVEDTFHFLGYHKNPYKFVSKADVFVCSSRREGFSTAVTEALILGVPVVSTCCSGAYELLGRDNEHGIVTPNSTEGIYEGLKQMLSDAEMRGKYRTEALARGKKFSKDATVAAVEKMLDSL